jgi:hypothetical protein
MIDHLSKYLLWRSLMIGQRNERVSEGDLINTARFWWYSGYETNENFF